MTFEEYYNYFRDGLMVAMSYEDIISVSWCDRFLFPQLNEQSVYPPFTYTAGTADGLHGGEFAKRVASRIFNNYREAEVAHLLTIENVSNNVPIRIRVLELMQEYQYKWHALYESMLVDSDYDILDNVNEVTSETITRTPDLLHSHSESATLGAQTLSDTMAYGSRLITEDSENKNKTYPYDDDVNGHDKEGNEGSLTHSETSRTDTNTTSIGAKTDSKSGTDSETGTEETVLERLRHGNIGITTSGQLIRDYRLTHDFNLVKIVADDIAKELFTGAW